MNYENMNPEASYLRDAYLEAEKDYVKELLKQDAVREMIEDLNNYYDANTLYNVAKSLTDRVESGLASDEEMEEIELKLIVVLAAIKDVNFRKELLLTPSSQTRRRGR